MPGIVGFIAAKGFANKTCVQSAMTESMMHEQFYTSGSLSVDSLGLSIGWVVHEGSYADCMPLWNESGDVCLVFTGEDYRDRSDIDRLLSEGHIFQPGNGSYLVHLYEESGDGFFESLNGRFAGILVDLRKRTATLFNDRYGLGRIYYTEIPEGFFFASEAKALLTVFPSLREIDVQSLAEYFSLGCSLQERSLFANIAIVPGGSAWTFVPGGALQKSTYFAREIWQLQATLSPSDYYNNLRETWMRVLPRYFFGREKSAVSLTGGKDSRMIMAWIRRSPGSLPCFTFCGMFRESEDARVARSVSATCRQPHELIEVGREFLSEFPSLAERTIYLTDGAMGVIGAPELYINRIARQIATVRITGNYGQEILRGEVAFKPMPLFPKVFDAEFYQSVKNAALLYDSERAQNSLSFITFKQLPWHHFSRLALELSQVTVRSPYIDNDLVRLAFRRPDELSQDVKSQLRLITEGDPELGRIGTDRGLQYGRSDIIARVRNVWKQLMVKAEYAYDYGMPQWLCKVDHILRPLHMERLFLGVDKFYHFRVWYRDILSSYVKDVLLDRRTLNRSYLNGRHVHKIVDAHTRGVSNYTLELHRLLSCELLQRLFIDSP